MADIPINPVTRRVEFTGNTGTGPFAFTFNVLAQADVAAYKNNTLLALTSDYTVSLNSNGTGSITLTSALIATDELVIIGDLALSRTTDFVTAGDLLASSLNEQFDSNVVMSQQLDERFDRTIRSQPGDINKNLYLPLVSSRASQLLSFDSSGNITTTSLSNVPDIGTVNLTVSGVASFADGSASAPSITNIGDTNTGMYFGAADQINFSVGGSEVISVASTGTTISGLSISSGDILLTDNSATALEIKEGSNNYLTFITTNGSEKISFGSTANPTFEVNGSFNQPLIAATTSFFSQTYSGATLSATNGSVNIESYSASKAGIVLNGSGDQITFTSPTLGFVGLVQVVGAITTNTSLNIASSTTVDGILDEDNMASNSATKLATQQSIKAYVDAQVGTVDTLAEVLGNGNTTGGTDIVVSANDVISLDDGTNALPSLTTTGDLNTGIYFPAADEVGITTGGTQRVKVDSTGINVTGTVTATGTSVFASLDISGDIDVDGTTNLDVVDIDGAVDMASTLAVAGVSTFTGDVNIAKTGAGDDTTLKVASSASSGDNDATVIVGNGGTGDSMLRFDYESNTDRARIGVTASDQILRFYTAGDNERLTIDSSGNVGIGTSSPQGVLDLGGSSSGRSLTFAKYNNIFGSYSEGSLNLTSNYYGDTTANAYKTSTTATFGAAGIEISGTGGTSTSGLIQFFVDAAASKTADAAFVPSERMRIDSSGNLLVGTTSNTIYSSSSEAGSQIGDGYIAAARAASVAYLNRLTTDGDIVEFRKDGSTVGSIGTAGGNLIVQGNPLTGKTGIKFGGAEWIPQDTGANSDGGVDLGGSSYRFKDLYLSGGVYLGGTGADNKLDDYEEGTWTPTVTAASGTITTQSGQVGTYTKIGREVSLHFQFSITDIGSASGNIIVSNLPFAKETATITYYSGIHRARSGTSSITEFESTNLQLYGTTPINSTYIGSITYTTS